MHAKFHWNWYILSPKRDENSKFYRISNFIILRWRHLAAETNLNSVTQLQTFPVLVNISAHFQQLLIARFSLIKKKTALFGLFAS